MDIERLKNKLLQRSRQIGPALVVAVLAGGAGYLLLGSTRAATFAAHAEAESGTVAGKAGAGDTSGASGSASVKFGTASTGGGSGSCVLPKYPSPGCTGVPGGAENATYSNTVNGYTVTTPGTVIDGWHVKGDLQVYASNVTIRNSWIEGWVDNESGSDSYSVPYTITDSTIGTDSSCMGMPGLGSSGYTATRVLVKNHDDGFRISGRNIVIQDSYFHACYLPPELAPPDGSHSDGIQAVCGQACGATQLLHNTLDLKDVPATFPVNLMDTHLDTMTVADNLLLSGGNYVISANWRSGSNWIFRDNRLVKDTWIANKPWPDLSGAVTAEGTCAHQTWTGNTVVTVDANYAVTGTLGTVPCVD